MSDKAIDGLIAEVKATRDALWNKSRSPQGREEHERYELAHRLNDAINAYGAAQSAHGSTTATEPWRIEVEAEEGCFAVDLWHGDIACRLNVFDEFEDANNYRCMVTDAFKSASHGSAPEPQEVTACSLCQGGHIHSECDTVGIVTKAPSGSAPEATAEGKE